MNWPFIRENPPLLDNQIIAITKYISKTISIGYRNHFHFKNRWKWTVSWRNIQSLGIWSKTVASLLFTRNQLCISLSCPEIIYALKNDQELILTKPGEWRTEKFRTTRSESWQKKLKFHRVEMRLWSRNGSRPGYAPFTSLRFARPVSSGDSPSYM